jgi:hypothetical protein
MPQEGNGRPIRPTDCWQVALNNRATCHSNVKLSQLV